MTLFTVVNVGGLILLVASAFAPVFLRRAPVQDRPAPWQGLWRRRWQLGILLGLLSFFSGWLTYPTTHHGREGFTRGIPFVVGGGTYVVGGGTFGMHEDLPSPLMVITMQLNFLFWLLLPQFVLWVTSGRSHGRKAEGPGPGSSR